MWNDIKKTTICLILFFCNLLLHAQTDSLYLRGCWIEVCTGIVYETINGKMQQTSWGVKGNEMRRMVLLSENKGAFSQESCFDDINAEDRFIWYSDSCKFMFKENEDCPYMINSYYTICSSAASDTLYLEHRYKNPDYKTIDMFVRDRIELVSDYITSKVKINRTDIYNAYHCRIIHDQIPFVYDGTFNNGKLILKPSICKYLQKMTQSDQVEVHVVESDPKEKHIVHILLISYDPVTRNIKNISFVDDYIRK